MQFPYLQSQHVTVEITMAGYWSPPRSIHMQKRPWPISSHLDITLCQQPIQFIVITSYCHTQQRVYPISFSLEERFPLRANNHLQGHVYKEALLNLDF